MQLLVNTTSTGLSMSARAIIRYNELCDTRYNPVTVLNWGDPIDSEYYVSEFNRAFPAILIGGDFDDFHCELDIPRNDRVLLAVFNELGDEFSDDKFVVIEASSPWHRVLNNDRNEYVEQLTISITRELLVDTRYDIGVINHICSILLTNPDAITIEYSYPAEAPRT